jgi:NADH dehydrogenase
MLQAKGANANTSRKQPISGRRPHVVLVGAGFGGLEAAKRLAGAPVDMTVIDKQNHHLFQPLLYQVATAALSPADIASPIRSVLRKYPRIRVVLGEVVDIDSPRRTVRLANGGEVAYDYLILATGSAYTYFGNPCWTRLAPGLKTLEDALMQRRRLLLAFEQAELTSTAERRNEQLTFVVAGAGPTGVEMAGALAELAKSTLARDFRNIDPGSARILLIEAGPRILAGFPEDLGRYAVRALERLGVEVLLDTPIQRVDQGVVVAGDKTIPAGTVIWCAGIVASMPDHWLPAKSAHGGAVQVERDMSVPGLPEVFVIGDSASLAGADGAPLPKLAPVAEQQGRYVANLISRQIAGKQRPGPFIYRDRGTLATIGRKAAVARFGRFHLKGAVAWLLWSLVHIFMLIGYRNRVLVFTNWVWQWFTYARGARLIIGPVASPVGDAKSEGTPERGDSDRR